MVQQPVAFSQTRFGLTRPMALILFTVFLDLLGIGLIFPIGPFYATAFGASPFDVGLLFTLFSVAQFSPFPSWACCRTGMADGPSSLSA